MKASEVFCLLLMMDRPRPVCPYCGHQSLGLAIMPGRPVFHVWSICECDLSLGGELSGSFKLLEAFFAVGLDVSAFADDPLFSADLRGSLDEYCQSRKAQAVSHQGYGCH